MENPVVATVLADTVPAASADRAVRVEDFTQLCPRAEGDPQRLYGRVTKTLDHYFFTRGLTYLDGQRDALSDIIKEVLDDSRQGVFAVPLVPGGGKSTLLRALLTVFAEVFRGMSDPITSGWVESSLWWKRPPRGTSWNNFAITGSNRGSRRSRGCSPPSMTTT